ncbi:MAG: YqjD family protein [Limisphaerales bacterium]
MTTQQANERLASDLKALMRDAEELMKATAGQAGEKVTEMRSRLAAAIDSAKATCHRLEEKTVAAAKVTDRTIREHPYESIGIAFGVGLLVGVLVGRK